MTGASSGIGRELVVRLAAGGVRVAASARSAPALADLAASHANLRAVPVDVTDGAAVKAAWEAIVAAEGVPELVVLNAGVWHPMPASEYDATKAVDSMAVNYLGIVHALQAVLPALLVRASGHIVLVASVAGYRGLPQAAAYAPSKAAVISLAETLRLELAGKGITVSLVNPGFVDTPMTAVNTFPMPYIITAADAADRILDGLKRSKFEIAFPWQLVGMLKLLRVLPYRLYFALTGRRTGA